MDPAFGCVPGPRIHFIGDPPAYSDAIVSGGYADCFPEHLGDSACWLFIRVNDDGLCKCKCKCKGQVEVFKVVSLPSEAPDGTGHR